MQLCLVLCMCVHVHARVEVMRNMLNEVSQCIYVINRVHCALGCLYIYFVDLIVFVLCTLGSC